MMSANTPRIMALRPDAGRDQDQPYDGLPVVPSAGTLKRRPVLTEPALEVSSLHGSRGLSSREHRTHSVHAFVPAVVQHRTHAVQRACVPAGVLREVVERRDHVGACLFALAPLRDRCRNLLNAGSKPPVVSVLVEDRERLSSGVDAIRYGHVVTVSD